MKYLVVDASNLLYRTFYANKNHEDGVALGMAMHSAFLTVNKYFRLFKPDKIVLCFDRDNWRKAYTMSDECYSKAIYKGLRRKDSTPKERQQYADFLKHIAEFEALINEHTTIICLAEKLLEGDDCIAAWVTRHQDPDDEHVIISGDGDFVQLLKFKNTRLVDPATGKDRTSDDPKYYLFEKLFRGEPANTDNVQSAYPKLRETKIAAAYIDPFAYTNLRNAVWTNKDGREMNVGKLLDENKLLMDLTAQPDDIQDIMDAVVVRGKLAKKKFSHFHFMKFLGKYELKKIAEQLESFVPMLSR